MFLQINRRDPRKSLYTHLAQQRPAGWLTRGEENCGSYLLGQAGKDVHAGYGEQWVRPKSYEHRANEPALPDAVAPGAGKTARW
jgi:hypothetical protein